jgi:hypothetical protein
MKMCRIGSSYKSLDSFGILKSSKDGRRTQCKECKSLEEKAKRLQNPESFRKSNKIPEEGRV